MVRGRPKESTSKKSTTKQAGERLLQPTNGEVLQLWKERTLRQRLLVEKANQQEEPVTFHSNKEDEIALATLSEKLVDYEHDWIINSGCSNHMIGDEKKLINMSEYKGGRVVVTANNSKMPITHIGKMFFVPHHSSRQVELQNVYHVPDFEIQMIVLQAGDSCSENMLFFLNFLEKRMENPNTTPVISTINMGKAMGSGTGVGRAGAGALQAPSNPMTGSGIYGHVHGYGYGWYGYV
ncbi:hypothetical protein H5410_005961 [Solanum commersonii]|uniref:Retrovirus-related Pol polyprotein from transposon TNT 1-94-like beta-barrel domain-containing protein n=1 Tax=Solanum commersonii TaxID=4109 RepID=A0A9J6A9U5_SOLCO|nr:hypothetical protein H5410_005961 [Solanum commersonii]